MSEPVFLALPFRNDGGIETSPACISQVPFGKRGGIYQQLSEQELSQFRDNLTLFWEANWDGEKYELIRPIKGKI